MRVNAVHLCHAPYFFKSVIWPVLAFVMGRFTRLRSFLWTGSNEEVLQDLSKFGIDGKALPRAMGGKWELDINAWISERMDLEREQDDTKIGGN